jgi:hypothetical protein
MQLPTNVLPILHVIMQGISFLLLQEANEPLTMSCPY